MKTEEEIEQVVKRIVEEETKIPKDLIGRSTKLARETAEAVVVLALKELGMASPPAVSFDCREIHVGGVIGRVAEIINWSESLSA